MRVLVATNMWPSGERPAHGIFVSEQVEALEARGHELHVLHLDGPGRRSRYLFGVRRLAEAVRRSGPDLVHAHYGLTGVVAAVAVRLPLVVTYHGSDVFVPWQRRLSRFAAERADANIFVAEGQRKRLEVPRSHVVPCGVDLEVFRPRDREGARSRFGFDSVRPRLLFPSAFDNPVKQFGLLRAALDLAPRLEVDLLELKDVDRAEVPWLFSAVDAVVLTSRHEGSPMVVKEALASGTPVVSVPVGDVPDLLARDERSRVVPPDPVRIRRAIEEVLAARHAVRPATTPEWLRAWSAETAARDVERIWETVTRSWSGGP